MKLMLITGIILIFESLTLLASAQCKPENLRCEYLVNPIGIDVASPRLTWLLTCPAAHQKGYELTIGTDSTSVSQGSGNTFQSTKVLSAKTLVSPPGIRLMPFTKYYWTVKIWNEKDELSAPSAVASFETGMMNSANWKGAWITDTIAVSYKLACYFRKVFNIPKKIKSARAYVAAAGLFELSVNGEKVGDHRLDPMYTRFDRRTLYVTYDITSQIRDGVNVVGLILGNGWFNHQSTAVWFFDKAPWRARPKFCMDVRITYEDGSVQTISTGPDWKRKTGPIIFNSIYTAEHHDARLEQKEWNTVNFNDAGWRSW